MDMDMHGCRLSRQTPTDQYFNDLVFSMTLHIYLENKSLL